MHSLFPTPKRVMIKVSGEVLKGSTDQVYEYDSIRIIAKKLIELNNSGIQVAVVVGG